MFMANKNVMNSSGSGRPAKSGFPASLVLILLALLPLGLSAAKPEKEIMTHSTGEGTVAFIKPRKVDRMKGSAAAKSMEFDVTLSTLSDSVSIAATIVCPQVLEPDSVRCNGSEAFALERIYCEPKSGKWVNRLRFYLSREQFADLFCSPEPIVFDWGGGATFEADRNRQKKLIPTNRLALEIIDLNKK